MIIVVRSAFHEGNKYFHQGILGKSLYKLWMLEYDRVNLFKETDVNKTCGSRKCIIYHYWFFPKINFESQPEFCKSCHDVANVSVNGNDYIIHVWCLSKGEGINLF